MTTNPDPHKYKGSGTYWKDHIRKHGYEVTTEILFESTNHQEFKRRCLKTSEELDVVRNPAYANLIPETGDKTNEVGQKAATEKIVDSIWVNDGEKDYRIQSGYIPGGFKRGRLRRWKNSTPPKIRYAVNGVEIRFNDAAEKYGVGIKKIFSRMRNDNLKVWHKRAYLDKPELIIEILE